LQRSLFPRLLENGVVFLKRKRVLQDSFDPILVWCTNAFAVFLNREHFLPEADPRVFLYSRRSLAVIRILLQLRSFLQGKSGPRICQEKTPLFRNPPRFKERSVFQVSRYKNMVEVPEMVKYILKSNSWGQLCVPVAVRKEWGLVFGLIPVGRAAILFPAGDDLKTVRRSLQLVVDEMILLESHEEAKKAQQQEALSTPR